MPNLSHYPRESAIIGLIIGCVLFGLGSLVVAAVPISASAMAFWRLFIGLIVFSGITTYQRGWYPMHYRACFLALLSGLFLAGDLALWHESIHTIGPGIATLLNSLQVFFLAIIGFIMFGERLNRLKIICLLAAVLGSTLIANPEFSHNQKAMWGFISGVLSGALLALSIITLRKMHEYESIPLAPLMSLINLGGSLSILPIALIDSHHFLPIHLDNIVWVVIYGVIVQCGAWTMISFAIPRIPLMLTGLLLLLEPIIALIFDTLIFSKPINILQWIGTGITLISIYLSTLQRHS